MKLRPRYVRKCACGKPLAEGQWDCRVSPPVGREERRRRAALDALVKRGLKAAISTPAGSGVPVVGVEAIVRAWIGAALHESEGVDLFHVGDQTDSVPSYRWSSGAILSRHPFTPVSESESEEGGSS